MTDTSRTDAEKRTGPWVVSPVVIAAVATHRGNVRRRNEDHGGISAQSRAMIVPVDHAAWWTTAKVLPVLAVVADGLGGHPYGDAASQLAVESLLAAAPGDPDALVVAAHAANAEIYRAMVDTAKRTMGTTLAAVLVHAGGIAVLNVGDSPVFRLAGDELVELSVMDCLSEAEDPYGFSSNVVTQTLGGRAIDEEITPHVHELEIDRSTRLLLCTDGLTNYADGGDIAAVLATGRPWDGTTDSTDTDSIDTTYTDADVIQLMMTGRPEDAAAALIELALAGGGGDNVTVAVVDVLVGKEAGMARKWSGLKMRGQIAGNKSAFDRECEFDGCEQRCSGVNYWGHHVCSDHWDATDLHAE